MISTLTFEHGQATCASEPGKFCRFFGTSGFGTRYVCTLFDNAPLHSQGGWVQRCPECLKAYPEPKDQL